MIYSRYLASSRNGLTKESLVSSFSMSSNVSGWMRTCVMKPAALWRRSKGRSWKYLAMKRLKLDAGCAMIVNVVLCTSSTKRIDIPYHDKVDTSLPLTESSKEIMKLRRSVYRRRRQIGRYRPILRPRLGETAAPSHRMPPPGVTNEDDI